MSLRQGNTPDSSEGTEKLTIAYAESARYSEASIDSLHTSSSEVVSSQSEETWTSEISMTDIYNTIEDIKRRDESAGYSPAWRAMSLTEGTKVRALDFFRSHSIAQLFSFLMSQLLVNTPPDPIPFLVSLLDRCLQYRDGDGSPPLLFEPRHVESLYSALDPLEDGSISYEQYLVGMATLGLTEFEIRPADRITTHTSVEKCTFIAESEKALLNQLNRLLGKELKKGTSQHIRISVGSQQHSGECGDNLDKHSKEVTREEEGSEESQLNDILEIEASSGSKRVHV